MGQRCVLRGCKNKGKNTADVRYHRFPRDPEVKLKWEEWVSLHNGKAWTAYKSAVICSVHFRPEHYNNGTLIPDSIPSILPAPVPTVSVNSVAGNCFPLPPVENALQSSNDTLPADSEPDSAPAIDSSASIPIPSSVGVNFMAVPVLTNSLVDGTPNLVIKVIDQPQLQPIAISQQQLPPVQQSEVLPSNAGLITPTFINVDNIKQETPECIDPAKNSQPITMDPLELYGDLSQFIIFKTNTCASLPTDKIKLETNGICQGSEVKIQLDTFLPSNPSAGNITSVIPSEVNPLCLTVMSTMNHVEKTESDTPSHIDIISKSSIKSEQPCSQGESSYEINTEMQSICGTGGESMPMEVSSTASSYSQDGGIKTNGDILLEGTSNSYHTNHTSIGVPSSTFTGVHKRCIDSATTTDDETNCKKFKTCAGDMQPEDFESPTSRVRNLSRLKDIINDKNRRLDNTQRTVRRLKERMQALESLLTHLKEDSQVSGYVKNIIREHFPQLDKP